MMQCFVFAALYKLSCLRLALSLMPVSTWLPPIAGAATTACHASFPEWVWNTSGSCKVLGAAVGQEHAHLARIERRRGKASKLLARIGDLSDGQAGLMSLSNCASYAKLMLSLIRI